MVFQNNWLFFWKSFTTNNKKPWENLNWKLWSKQHYFAQVQNLYSLQLRYLQLKRELWLYKIWTLGGYISKRGTQVLVMKMPDWCDSDWSWMGADLLQTDLVFQSSNRTLGPSDYLVKSDEGEYWSLDRRTILQQWPWHPWVQFIHNFVLYSEA